MNPKLKADIEKYLKEPKNKILISVLGIFVVFLFLNSLRSPDSVKATEQELQTADTVIPAGYVLVPIELENAASMSSMIGDFGVVDLFSAKNEKSPRGHKVGVRLKLLKAPLNPEQYAVLVREEESASILEARGPFFAVIQNPEIQKSASVYKKNSKAKSRIEYFSEGENL